jgi:ribonuclease P protein component
MVEHFEEKRNFKKPSYSFPRSRKLKKQKIIKELFQKKSSSVFLHPFRLSYLTRKDETRPQILISVSKKYFKKAVDRNRIKRQITEAYRLQEPFFQNLPYGFLAITYIAKELNETDFIRKRIRAALTKLIEENS